MDATVTLQAHHALSVFLSQGSICDARGARRRLGGAALETPHGSLHLLDLESDLLGIQLLQYICSRCRQQGKDCERAILLVLFKSSSKAIDKIGKSAPSS